MKLCYEDKFVKLYNGDVNTSIKDRPWLHIDEWKRSNVVTITDPPFNIGYHYKGYADKIECALREAS